MKFLILSMVVLRLIRSLDGAALNTSVENPAAEATTVSTNSSVEGKPEDEDSDNATITAKPPDKGHTATEKFVMTKSKLSNFMVRQLEKWNQYLPEDGKRNVFTAETHEGFKCVQKEDDDHCAIQSIELYKNIFNMWQCEKEEDGDFICRCGYGLDEDGPREWDDESHNCLIPAGRPCDYTSERVRFIGKCVEGHVCQISSDEMTGRKPLTGLMICVASATILSSLSVSVLIVLSAINIIWN